jgi:surface carbohydrate biosynthesis protein
MNEPVAPDVYFPIEIMSREYSGHVLLAVELAARGRTSIIGHKGPVARAMHETRQPGLLFYKNARLPGWADDRHALVGLDPEAGIVYLDFKDFFDVRSVMADASPSLAQFCFGPDDHEFLVRRFPTLSNRVHLTGAPRVSLWGDDGKIFHRNDIARIAEHFGHVLVFASSGGFTHERYVEHEGQEPQSIWSVADHAHHFFRMAEAAARAFEVPVVIRPHPSDSWVAWRKVAAAIPNLHVESGFDLAAWTRCAHAIVHPGTSTAAFESVSAGVPAISTGSSPEGPNAAGLISHTARDEQHLLELLANAITDDLPTFPSESAEATFRRKIRHPLDGAASRIADVLDAVVPYEGSSGIRLPRRLRLPAFLRRGDAGPSFDRPDVRPFKRDPIPLGRLERDVSRAAEVLGHPDRFRVRQLSADCFVITG